MPSAQKTLKRSQREIEKDVRRFERRGERETKLARTRVERLVRRNRRAFEREAGKVERSADRRDNVVTERLAGVSKAAAEGVTAVSNRVEETVQVGVATGGAHRDPRQGRHRVARSTFPRPPRRAAAGYAYRPHIPPVGFTGLISRRRTSVPLLPQPSPFPSGGGDGL